MLLCLHSRIRRLRWITEVISQYALNFDGTSYSDFSHGFTFSLPASKWQEGSSSRASAGGTLMSGTISNCSSSVSSDRSEGCFEGMEAKMWENIEARMEVMEQNSLAQVGPQNSRSCVLRTCLDLSLDLLYYIVTENFPWTLNVSQSFCYNLMLDGASKEPNLALT